MNSDTGQISKNNILLFGGTTEGRLLAQYCAQKGIEVCLCAATEYAESILESHENICIRAGRKDCAEMEVLINEISPKLVIDATHPYADEATKNIRAACENTRSKYIRLIRASEAKKDESALFFRNTEAAVDFLNKTDGRVLLTVGSKELKKYTAVKNFEKRLFVRILPRAEAILEAGRLGYPASALICMQGPFSKEMNRAMLKEINARFIVTKDTGEAGGFPEKLAAAKEEGIKALVISRPLSETGLSLEECKKEIDSLFPEAKKKRISIAGMGMGDINGLTLRSKEVCGRAELFVGAKRLLDGLSGFWEAEFAEASDPKNIAECVKKSDKERIVVAVSGDVGFFSGTKKLLELLDEEVEIIPGISSVQYFFAKLGLPWEDAKFISVHGRNANFISKIRRNRKTFAVVGGKTGVKEYLLSLCENGLENVLVAVGENLSYKDEKISRGTPAELLRQEFSSLAVVYAENSAPIKRGAGLPDEAFLRANVPMTKSEIRAVIASRLNVQPDSVCWDIGAGTGSVSVEMAEAAEDGTVYAIESMPSACELIEANKKHFGITNIEIINGKAPEALASLPAPTHVFVGGTKGRLIPVLEFVFEKNPSARVALTAVTAESFSEALGFIKRESKRGRIENINISQINVARYEKMGEYNLLKAQNPVFVMSFDGKMKITER
ncbi:MAG: precorrin-6A reductase [Firmicutes bacterium]|nr:precorrin-6A reductase [Bacillota bacterium]